ncbi:MAG: hypothetical protein ACI910_000452 [Oleispira sp.]|jgi:hypothetical protein
MRFVSSSFVFLLSFLILSGCSDSGGGSSSSTSNIEGWVGAQGLNNAQVVINQVAESGQVAVDNNGIYSGVRESTDISSRFTAWVANDEVLLFIARGQIADVDKDKDNLATQRQCQLVLGCTVKGIGYSYADFYPASEGFEWRSTAYTVSSGSRNNVNALTTLAAAYAYQYDVKYGYDNHQNHAGDPLSNVASDEFENEIFTPYDVVLANSQTSNVLGLQDIIGDLPANLTQLNTFNKNTELVRNQIRYGALLAGLQQLELTYWAENNDAGDADFISLVASEFAEDSGQFYLHTPDVARVLTLQNLYQAAHDNLVDVIERVANTEAKAAANAIVAQLLSQIESFKASDANSKTNGIADELSLLLTANEFEAFNLGLEKTKLFINDLLSYQATFWQPGYKSELDDYLSLLKNLGDEQRENLELLTTEFSRIQSYYLSCNVLQPNAAKCSEAYTPEANDPDDRDGLLDIKGLNQSYDASTKVLTLSSGNFTSGITIFKAVTVSQKIADINVVDNNENPTSSNAIDVLITGELEKANLVLTLAHDLDTAEETIETPSSMRLYYNQEISELPTTVNTELEIRGYELIWGEFQLYDKSKVGVDFDAANPALGAEIELSGAFRIFYRGLRDPQDANSELRFNIESWVLSSSISDQVDDETGADREFTSLVISGRSSNPDSYYPARTLAKFDGFFSANNANSIGDEVTNLLTYRMGQENVEFASGSVDVQTIDFINAFGDDIRYRFYPNERVIDENDLDRDGDITEVLDMHRIEECVLDEISGNIKTCGPKSRVYDTVNVQKTINDLWELGLFQRIPVNSKGTYFVDFPTKTDDQGCLVLDTLSNDQMPMKGSLIEQQVLGLDSVRLLTEVQIEDADLSDLSRTLLDISIVAPSLDKYRITAGLSHNYSGTIADDSGIILGSGGTISSLLVSYDTSADFENAGNLSIAKGGVTLTLNDQSVVSENQDITAFLSQSYDPASVNYTIIEDAEGQPDRCVSSVGSNYVKNPADAQQVFHLNYRDVLYGTIRPEGSGGIWTIRYIDGSWIVPSSVSENVVTGS